MTAQKYRICWICGSEFLSTDDEKFCTNECGLEHSMNILIGKLDPFQFENKEEVK